MLSNLEGVKLAQSCGKDDDDMVQEKKGGLDTESLIEDLTEGLAELHALGALCSTLKEVVEQLLSRLPPREVSTSIQHGSCCPT